MFPEEDEEEFEGGDEPFEEEQAVPAQEEKPQHLIDIVTQSMNPVKNAPPIPEAMYTYEGEGGSAEEANALSAPEAANDGENLSGSEQQQKVDDLRAMFYSKYMQKQFDSAEYQERVKAENSERP